MRLTQFELLGVAAVIVYIAFFSRPVPSVVQTVFSNPVGQAATLLAILYVAAHQSMILGVFLGIAFLVSSGVQTEYLDPKEQAPKKETPQPKAAGVPPPAVTGMLNSILSKKKGDTRLPQAQGKSVTEKPAGVVPPKPTLPTKTEHFASF
jgi:hypothetical protein